MKTSALAAVLVAAATAVKAGAKVAAAVATDFNMLFEEMCHGMSLQCS